MSRRARAQGRRGTGLAALLAALAGLAVRPAPAQLPPAREPALALYDAMAPPGFWSAPAPQEGGVVEVDVQARFEAFQRELAEDFGGSVEAGDGNDGAVPGARLGEAFVRRWEGSRMFRMYERVVGVYDRFEGVYQRIETSTRWATRGFRVDPNLEAAVDGKLRLAVERRVMGFDMGVKVDDAVNGKLGLQLGGVVRGYKFGFDVSDVVNDGRVSFQVRRITK